MTWSIVKISLLLLLQLVAMYSMSTVVVTMRSHCASQHLFLIHFGKNTVKMDG